VKEVLKKNFLCYTHIMAAKAKDTNKVEIKKNDTPAILRIRSFILKNIVFFLALIVVLIAGALYYFRGYFVAATVNGEPISRYSVIRQLESQGGQEVLQGKITEALIRQEGNSRGVEVTETEIDAEIATLKSEFEAQGQDFQQILDLQGMSMDELKKQIHIQLMVEKMFSGDIDVTQEEIDQYIADYGDTLPEYENDEQMLSAVRENLEQTKLVDSFQTWLQTAQTEAEINYLFEY